MRGDGRRTEAAPCVRDGDVTDHEANHCLRRQERCRPPLRRCGRGNVRGGEWARAVSAFLRSAPPECRAHSRLSSSRRRYWCRCPAVLWTMRGLGKQMARRSLFRTREGTVAAGARPRFGWTMAGQEVRPEHAVYLINRARQMCYDPLVPPGYCGCSGLVERDHKPAVQRHRPRPLAPR